MSLPLLDSLNAAQRQAVDAPDGPLLIFAGAGSGKTRVLTHRIAHVIASRGVRPSEILAVTFTNKAAREMRSRVEALLEGATPGLSGMWLGTFHSIGVRMLRRDGDCLGIPSNFTIYDEADRLGAIRRSMTMVGVDDKRFPAKQIAHEISKAKNELQDASTFEAQAADIFGGNVARVFRTYEVELKNAAALDFDDLLVRSVQMLCDVEPIRRHYQERFRHIFVDEYQDTNRAQYVMVSLLAEHHRNLTVVGDDDQCLATGTPILMADGRAKAIEEITAGELVASNYGSGDVRSARVISVYQGLASGDGVAITTASGRTVVSTLEHTHFAGYRTGEPTQTFFTYLMYKRGVGCRIGTSQVNTKGQARPVAGFRQRCMQEHADALWIISTHENENDARADEYIASLGYQIPTLPFVPRRGNSSNGLVHDAGYLDKVFRSFDTEASGRRLVHDRGLLWTHPHHVPHSRNSNRRNIVLTLCGDRRGASPMHRISMVGNDRAGHEALESIGLSVRPAKAGSESWRYESAFADFGAALAMVERIQRVFADLCVLRNARLGKNGPVIESCSLGFLPAGSVHRGMVMFDAEGGYDPVVSVGRVPINGTVHDLNIERTHNYIANGLVTHNSIYGWRGADVRNILSFRRDYPDATVVTLEQNYRSTQNILDTAHAVIRNNSERAHKKLWTECSGGARVQLLSVYDEQEEALAVVHEIDQLVAGEFSLSDVAVLFRTNAQSRAFEDIFLRRGMPYRLVGGMRFYERREVKDVLAYLRLIANPRDPIAFSRIVNVPRRKIGDKTLAEVEKLARRKRISLFDAVHQLDDAESIGSGALKALDEFGGLIDSFRERAALLNLSDLMGRVLSESGYQSFLRDGTPEGEERWSNVTELVGLAAEYAAVPPPEGLAQFLENVALVSDVDVLDESQAGVTLITLHAVKGLEFPVVFLVGMEEGLLPHMRAMDEGEPAIAEERRLAYVGVTRAERRLYLLHAFRRHIYGAPKLSEASRFLKEIPAELLEVVRRVGGVPVPDPRAAGVARQANYTRAASPNPVDVAPQRYHEGSRVKHPALGAGTVLKSTMTRAGEEVVIKFDKSGVKIFAVGESAIRPVD